MLRSLLATLLLLLTVPSVAAPSAHWRADLKAAADAVRLRHPDPFTRLGPREFDRRYAQLEHDLGGLSEEQRAVRALQLFAAIGEGHTFADMTGAAFANWYPVRFYEFTDGLFIVSAHRSIRELAGAQVLEIAGRPAAAVMREARSLVGADNELGEREAVFAASNAALMRGLGFVSPNGRLAMRVRRTDGRVVRVELPAMTGSATIEWRNRSEVFGIGFGEFSDWISAYRHLGADAFRARDASLPLHFRYRRHFIAVPLPDRDAYYAQINYMLDASDETLEQFFRRVLAEVDRQRPRRLILDFRYNSGGDGSKIAAIIHQFIAREHDRPWRELYVLTGRKTFSAAVNAAEAFFDHVPVTFVGEPAGAAFSHAGNADQIPFPATGLQLTVSTAWHGGSSDRRQAFTPVDVPALFSSADYIAGRDPAVDAILRGDEMRGLAMIAEGDGAVAVRRAFEDRRARFGNLAWWVPADMHVMNATGYRLRGANRMVDALEVFRINTEIYPDSWYTWDSLGEAQLAAGEREAGLASYRHSLALNPGNAPARRIIEEAERANR
jgi:hypothetical protein